MIFSKYQALGNDYIVIDPEESSAALTEEIVKRICDRRYGVGADGILYGPFKSKNCDFGLKIYNPDGSEAEKSGNGLRLFSRYLRDKGQVKSEPFSISTKGGEVVASVNENGSVVSVQMGVVRFTHGNEDITRPVAEAMEIEGRTFEFYRAKVGNPHCVILVAEVSAELAHKYGPLIERNPLFPDRTNVQFIQVDSNAAITIEIWERGAGYTLASGSSSVASAAVSHGLGLCESKISVSMPGGVIDVSFDDRLMAMMTGAVGKVCDGCISTDVFA